VGGGTGASGARGEVPRASIRGTKERYTGEGVRLFCERVLFDLIDRPLQDFLLKTGVGAKITPDWPKALTV